jgi:hypothetical protein
MDMLTGAAGEVLEAGAVRIEFLSFGGRGNQRLGRNDKPSREDIMEKLLVLCLVIVLTVSGKDTAVAQSKEKPEDRLKALLQARLEAAKADVAARTSALELGLLGFESLHAAARRLLEAQREVNDKRADQIKALKAYLNSSKKIHLACKEAFEEKPEPGVVPARISLMDVKKAEFYRLEAELWLERAKAGKANQDRLKGLLKARFEAAKIEVKGYMDLIKAKRNTPEILVGSSRRLLETHLELSDKKLNQVAALETYLEVTKK